ncbi:MAG: aminotransferase class IV [Pseudomonadota bacterium]
MKTFYVDGHFVPENQAVIPVDDLAILRGLGVCDLMRTYQGRPFFLEEHIQRLEHSAGEIGLTLPWACRDMEAVVIETLEKNPGIDEANIRIIITGGSSPDFMTPMGKPRLLVLITPIPRLPDTWYTQGVKVITVMSERDIPEAKSISYIPATLALQKAHQQGAIEALFYDRRGFVREGTTSNLFAFIDGRLVTPEDGVLKGITRKVILALAAPLFEIELRAIRLEELLSAQEVFITGTNKGIVPVVTIDNNSIGNGMPGKRTGTIIQALDRHAAGFKDLRPWEEGRA